MDGSDRWRLRPFRTAIARWRAVPGGIDADGRPVNKPSELAQAELILGICERFGQLPGAVLAEDVSLLRLLHLEDLGGGRDGPPTPTGA